MYISLLHKQVISEILPKHKLADSLSSSKMLSFSSRLQEIFLSCLLAAGTGSPTSSQTQHILASQTPYCCTRLAVTATRTLKLLQGPNLEQDFCLLTIVQQEKVQFLANYTALVEWDISLSCYCHTENSIFFRETSRSSTPVLNYCHQLS